MFALLALILAAWGAPWGVDADLAQPCVGERCCQVGMAAQLDGVIRFHQKVISPTDGPRSHFYPSSSQYGRDAIYCHGPGLGLLMTFDRLLRENSEPWVYPLCHVGESCLKFDPVPQN
jgi:putative component of membrane protein insertase Oxa1/YidC/SpoIIIJ protein YidD